MEGLSPLLGSPHKARDPCSHLVVYPSVRERQVLNMFHLVYNPSQVQNPIRVRQLYLE